MENSHTILIVDDVSRNIQILGNILAKENYHIAYARGGQEALKIAAQQNFDLILLDIMMPGMDGYEVCNRLKGNDHTKETPIIFLTAKADMESIIHGFTIGGQDYITKPFNSAELLSRVRTHILLQEQKKQLKQANSQLEEKVAQRTTQLETANQRLGILDKAKSDFLSIISHELRTPLNGLIGLTHLLDQSNIDPEQREYLSYLKEVSARLVNFSETALLITSLRMNNYNHDLMAVSVDHIIDSAITEYKENEKNKSDTIHFESDGSSPLIFADADLIRRSCLMIIDNAFKFGGAHCKLNILSFVKNDLAIIEFIDDGPGFSEAAMEHVFNLFSSGDMMHTEGSGLSLSAVKLVMDAHDATITIHKQATSGARICMEFKVAKQ